MLMKIHSAPLTDKYIQVTAIISIAVAFLIHFPELISLFDFREMNSMFPGIRAIDVANEILFTFLSLILLFTVNTILFGFNKVSRSIGWQKIILSFVLTWIVNNLLAYGFVFLHQTLDIPAIDAMIHHYLHPLRDFVISCIVTGSCYIIYLVRRQQQVLVENQQLVAENNLNQYEALKNQLNPHMLFNSLNTLQSLVREDAAKAQSYIQELSRVLRYTLQSNTSQKVSLQQEMEFVSAYTFLMKMRYEDNLQFDIQIEKQYEDKDLPPMAVQMLIENAIKHNEISNRRPLVIHIFTDPEGGITVSNPIQQKRSHSGGTGIGLANLSKRYQLLFHREIRIKEDTHFIVHIPLIAKQP